MALAVCGVIQLYRGLRLSRFAKDAAFNFSGKSILFFLFYLLYMLVMVRFGDVLSTLYGGFLPHGSGFVVSTALFLLIALPVLGRRKPVEICSVAVITTGILVVSFGGFFKILLP